MVSAKEAVRVILPVNLRCWSLVQNVTVAVSTLSSNLRSLVTLNFALRSS